MKNNQLNLFLVACLSFAFGGLTGSALGVVWIYMQAQFDMPLSALGILLTVSTLGRLLTSFASGSIVGRFGIAWMLMAGISVTFAGMLCFAFAPIWVFIFVAGFLTGAGSGVMGTGLNVFAAMNFSSSRMNWLHGSFGIGATVGPILVTVIVIDLNLAWQSTYIVFAVIQIAIFLLFYSTRNQWRIISTDDEQQQATPLVKMTDTLRLPIVWLLILTFMVATSTEVTTGQYANTLLVEGRGIDPKIAGTWVSMYWASLTVSRFLVGFIIKRVSNGTFLRLNMIGTMVGVSLLWANISSISSFIGLAIIGFTVAPFAPLMVSDTPLRVGKAHTANTVGFQFTGVGIGLALLPWLAGVLAETFGLEVIPPFLLLIAGATFLLHEAILWREAQKRFVPTPTH